MKQFAEAFAALLMALDRRIEEARRLDQDAEPEEYDPGGIVVEDCPLTYSVGPDTEYGSN